MDAFINIETRLLPKTGQSIEYNSGDDGTYQKGWFKGRTVANNKTRYVSKSIGGEVVVFDRATGLVWAADRIDAGCNNGGIGNWADAITYAEGLTFAGFSNWRLPNVLELISIINFSKDNPAIDDPPFLNSISLNYWSSTTYNSMTTVAWTISLTYGNISSELKTNSTSGLRCVRSG